MRSSLRPPALKHAPNCPQSRPLDKVVHTATSAYGPVTYWRCVDCQANDGPPEPDTVGAWAGAKPTPDPGFGVTPAQSLDEAHLLQATAQEGR